MDALLIRAWLDVDHDLKRGIKPIKVAAERTEPALTVFLRRARKADRAGACDHKVWAPAPAGCSLTTHDSDQRVAPVSRLLRRRRPQRTRKVPSAKVTMST